MNLAPAIRELYDQKKQIEKTIAALEAFGLPAKNVLRRRGRKFMNAAERRQVSERMRKYWAGRRNQTEENS